MLMNALKVGGYLNDVCLIMSLHDTSQDADVIAGYAAFLSDFSKILSEQQEKEKNGTGDQSPAFLRFRITTANWERDSITQEKPLKPHKKSTYVMSLTYLHNHQRV